MILCPIHGANTGIHGGLPGSNAKSYHEVAEHPLYWRISLVTGGNGNHLYLDYEVFLCFLLWRISQTAQFPQIFWPWGFECDPIMYSVKLGPTVYQIFIQAHMTDRSKGLGTRAILCVQANMAHLLLGVCMLAARCFPIKSSFIKSYKVACPPGYHV